MRHFWTAATCVILSFALLYLACDGERIPVDNDTASVPDVSGGDDAVVTPVDLTPDQAKQDSTLVDTQAPEDLFFLDVGDGPGDVVDGDVVPPQDIATTCPADPPFDNGACTPGTSCAYGQECCCGQCFDSLVCNCGDSGTFGCYNTDACYGGGWCDQPPCCEPAMGYDPCIDWVEGMYCHALAGDQGKCLKEVKYPSCWSHNNCQAGEQCQGADVCPCDADCDMEDSPGTCVGSELPQGCCYQDEDCDQGTDAAYVCGWNEMSGEWGRCMWLLAPGQCWDSSDCTDGKVCNGAAYCPCDAPCGMADMPGKCMDPNQAGDIGDPCGQDGGDCKQGLVCCYPCGIQGCIFECSEPCDASEPWCEGGCPMYA